MDVDTVPAALQHRLGVEGTLGLVAVLDRARSEWSNDVISISAERFDRRLAEEAAKLRVAISDVDAALRVAIANSDASLRVAIAHSEAALRREIGASEKSLIKWSFVFWIGQVVAVAGIMSVMLRMGSP